MNVKHLKQNKMLLYKRIYIAIHIFKKKVKVLGPVNFDLG